MQNSASAHTRFFTSLKHLEKRLKLENHHAAGSSNLPQPPPPPIESQEVANTTQETDSLGTPIYLCNQSAATNTNASDIQESEAPQEFLSKSPDSPPTNHAPPIEAEAQETVNRPEKLNPDDDIELLMQLLRLSDAENPGSDGLWCDDEFYGRIVGVKGPKNVKELERLELWIKHFLSVETEKKEPFRLAHLLLAKAAFMHSMDDGFGGIVFPSTIDEFLQNDPPID